MIGRRAFGSILVATAATTPSWLRGRPASGQSPALVVPDRARPGITHGVASGEADGRSALVWSRTDRPARMIVEWATTESFRGARRVVGPAALPEDDYTAKVVLDGLPPGQRVVYRVTFQDLGSPKVRSHPARGSFRTPPDGRADVRFAWVGDTAGQGWGIDPSRGGMRIYESIRQAEPDSFLHSDRAGKALHSVELAPVAWRRAPSA